LWNERKLRPTDFYMPKPNDFICRNFDIITDAIPSKLEVPDRIFKSDVIECFYKLDGKFKLPQGFICIHLLSPLTISSIRYMNLTLLYSMIVKYYLTEKLYPAVCAGLGYQVYSEEKGMVVKLSGYNEKLPLLLDIIIKELKHIGELMEESVFETYKKQSKKYLYNSLIDTKFFNKDTRLNVVEEHHKYYYDRYNETDSITFEELKEFSGKFLQQMQIQLLVQGNFTKDDALKIKDAVQKLQCTAVDKGTVLESRARKIPIGQNLLHLKSMLPNDKNSTTTNYYQIGESSIRLQCLIEFVMKIIEEPLFDILRTQEQLGYAVSNSYRFNNGILGFSVYVQSQENKNPSVKINQRIEKFLCDDVNKILEKLTDEEFETVQTALIKLKNMVEVELESEVNRFWSEITSKEYIFNRLELEADALALLTKQDVIDFYKTRINVPEVRKLSIQIIGTASSESIEPEDCYVPVLNVLSNCQELLSGQNVITDMNEFKEKLDFYPVTKTKID